MQNTTSGEEINRISYALPGAVVRAGMSWEASARTSVWLD